VKTLVLIKLPSGKHTAYVEGEGIEASKSELPSDIYSACLQMSSHMMENDKNLYFNASNIVYLSAGIVSDSDRIKLNQAIRQLEINYPQDDNNDA